MKNLISNEVINNSRLKGIWEVIEWFIVLTLLCLAAFVVHALSIEHRFKLDILLYSLIPFFIIHSWVPLRFRSWIQILLSLALPFFIYPIKDALILDGLLLALSFFFLIPVKYPLKYFVSIGGLASCMVFYWLLGPHWEGAGLLTIAGSFFMFRGFVYLYDESNGLAKGGLIQRLNYFLSFPNHTASLFPILDSASFQKSLYKSRGIHIYKKGILLLFTAILQFMLYRILYYYVVPDPTSLHGLVEVLTYLFVNFLLVLRVVAIFHFSVASLMLAGYDLDPIFRSFFFANSFGDLWKRINIYWKDFVMKLIYYPLFFRLKKGNVNRAMILATFISFIISWWLHSWQWFWLKGTFPITEIDAIFWILFGSLVTYNTWETINKKKDATQRNIWVDRLLKSIQALGIFVIMSVLWSLWISPALIDWLRIFQGLRIGGFKDVFIGLAYIFTYLGLAFIYYTFFDQKSETTTGLKYYLQLGIIALLVSSLLLLTQRVFLKTLKDAYGIHLKVLAKSERLNRFDQNMQENGYYDNLVSGNNYTSPRWEMEQKIPDKWVAFGQVDEVCIITNDMMEKKMRPNGKGILKLAEFKINEHGMRDKSYSLKKPSKSIRIGVFGASYEVGEGVLEEQIFENITENKLNREYSFVRSGESEQKNLEILNFSVSGYKNLQQVRQLEEQALPFELDYAFVFHHSKLSSRFQGYLARIINKKMKIFYPEVINIINKYGLYEERDPLKVELNSNQAAEEVRIWSDSVFAQICLRKKIHPVWVCIASLEHEFDQGEVEKSRMEAEKFGYTFLDLSGVFNGISKKSLMLKEWDAHPNVEGHKIISVALEDAILSNQKKLNLNLTPKGK